jgi:hypothetical protein
VHDKIITKYT